MDGRWSFPPLWAMSTVQGLYNLLTSGYVNECLVAGSKYWVNTAQTPDNGQREAVKQKAPASGDNKKQILAGSEDKDHCVATYHGH